MVKLSVVIVSYNVCYFLEQALLSVRAAAARLGAPVEVFVVDNHSQDDSVGMVRARFPEVILIENQDNPGFAKANNQALRQATGQYRLLLNPDTLVAEDALRTCCEFMDAHPRGGGLGVRMLDGQGRFLPESKRGLPTPAVAFYKISGLAGLFPRSRTFGRYHLGFLSEDEAHEVDVLSGAFMLLRAEALAQVGLLDEDYFMYGEDIDLSYRLLRGGWQNWYFPGARILHYKGESTRRTSVNYVLVFYRAMVIFARKHFAPGRARAFSLLLNAAIWARAGLALLQRGATAAAPVLLDGALIFGGLAALKVYWEHNHKFVRQPYPPQYLLVAVPLYIATWLTLTWLSGGYDRPVRPGRVVRGVVVGTGLISAVSNFFDAWRFSKALIVLGGAWAVAALLGRQVLAHWLRHGRPGLDAARPKVLAFVGSAAESARARLLLAQAQVPATVIGYVSPDVTLVPGAWCLVPDAQGLGVEVNGSGNGAELEATAPVVAAGASRPQAADFALRGLSAPVLQSSTSNTQYPALSPQPSALSTERSTPKLPNLTTEHPIPNTLRAEAHATAQPPSPKPQGPGTNSPDHLGPLSELPALLKLYGLTELVFCGQDLSAAHIIDLMARLPARPAVAYKILPAGSDYIIGSSDRDAPGDYYARPHPGWQLAQPGQRRAKRLLDLMVSMGVLVLSPLLLAAQRRPAGLLPNAWRVLRGRRSWVGLRYLPEANGFTGIVSPADVAAAPAPDAATRQRLERLYAENYAPGLDARALWHGWRGLGG